MSYPSSQGTKRRCCRTGRELKPGDVYFAALVRTEEGLVRLDFAPEAWQGPPANAIGYWRGRVPVPARRRRRIDDATALRLFEQLEQTAGEDHRLRLVRYLLALHLMRRRILRLVRIEVRGDQEYIRVRHTREKTREWLVWSPVLEEGELRELEGQLDELLAPLLASTSDGHRAA